MTLWDGYENVPFLAVRNPAGQFSLWPTSRPTPAGWEPVGEPAPRAEVLARIEEVWVDGRPAGTGAPSTFDAPGGGSLLVGPAVPRPAASVVLLAEQAPLPGDRAAMRCGAVELTRAEMFATARAWASALAGTGACGRERPVAVLVPRGTDAMLAILAVLYTGSAYVPLACDDAPQRRAAILADTGDPLVVAADEMLPALADHTGPVITISALRERGAEPIGDVGVAPDDLAFVIYTSGTTGRPKGVEGTHRQLTNYALWCRETFPHAEGERTTLHAPLAFLGSLTTMFTPLLAGWPIEIAPEGATVDDVLALATRVPTGLLKLTPTHVRMLLARGAADQRLGRHFMIGSEPLVLTPELADWMRRVPEATFCNHYGLTETHGCFWHPFGPDAPLGSGVPIGLPIDNVRAHVVDEHGDDVPPGQTGELLVAGESIGRGYRNSPALTAERWVPDRHGAPGARILRTGDLARLRSDGVVEVLGRADRMVKVRGHRVEPAAVEYALRARPEVLEALVLPRVHDGATTLAAYVVGRGPDGVDVAAIHQELAAVLPAPSVPSRYAVLTEFPMTPNGKIDAAALPEPQAPARSAGGAGSSDDGGSADSDGGRWTRMELLVADAYAENLGVEAVGLHDDFFALGGDSLSAVGVAMVLGERLDAKVPVPALGNGTVRSMRAGGYGCCGGGGVLVSDLVFLI